MNDPLHQKKSRQDAGYMVAACLGVAVAFAVGWVFITLLFLIE